MNTRKLLASAVVMLCLSTNINAQQSVSISNPPVELQTAHTADKIQSAILFGSPDDVKALIRSQADANAMYECNTPLTLAIRSILGIQEQRQDALKYSIEKIKYLIAQGADVNQEICQRNARFPLVVVLAMPLELQGYEELSNQAIDIELQKNGYYNIPNLISKPCKDITKDEISAVKATMHNAFLEVRKTTVPYLMDMLKLLVENGADINKKDTLRGRTALHHAVEIPSELTIEPIHYLISKGADINSPDFDGNTPLFIAEMANNKEAVKLLIKAGADTTIRNKYGVRYNEVIGLRASPSLKDIINKTDNLNKEKTTDIPRQ